MRFMSKTEDARILVVDDEQANVLLLERMLRSAGYGNVESTMDPTTVRDLLVTFGPDLILLDLSMPGLDGFNVMELVKAVVPDAASLPILVLTADASTETKRRALASGARDFLTKPFDVEEVLLRVRNMVETRQLHLELRAHNRDLEERVRDRTLDLEEARNETLERLAIAAEFRDDETGQHTRRVAEAARLIAWELGLGDTDSELIGQAARLHDVGKIGVPDSILLKPGKLTAEEFEVVKTHTAIGAQILSGSDSALLQMAAEIAWTHHERWDGGGYGSMTGTEIPLAGRITTVADVFDALTHERPYKEAWPVERAIEEIVRCRGTQFDPDAVDAFMHAQDSLAAMSNADALIVS